MLCVICKRKFNRESSFYRHNWSDKHLLKQQIVEYEKEIKTLEETIAQYRDKSDTQSQIMHIPILEKCVTYA
jgi:hypothetical protein